MKKGIIGGGVLAVVLGVLAYSEVVGIPVETTHLAFCRNAGSPVVESRNGRNYLFANVTPSKYPAESFRIYWAARLHITVRVTLPARPEASAEQLTFRITGMTSRGDFTIPCDTGPECRRILEALAFQVPPELVE